MRRVGLYLEKKPDDGGAFQYSMSMLEAVKALPRDLFVPAVAYRHKAWRDIVLPFNIESSYIPSPFAPFTAAYFWRKLGFPIEGWRKFSPIFDLPTRKLLAMACDLWIFPGQDPMSYMLPTPALSTVHDLMHRYENRFPEVSGQRMRELHYHSICRYAKAVLVDSDLGKQQLVESYDIDHKKVFPLPFIPPSYMYITDEPPDFDNRYHLPKKFFFYPAQFWNHKNHLGLLQAAHSIIKQLPDIYFVFVGAKKNGYSQLIGVINELGLSEHVQVLEYVSNEDMPALYCRARAMIMPTFFGPTNIPPLEAMVVGCPMAVSRIYAMPEQCGDASLYFDPASVDEIAHCMFQLWTDDDLCKKLSRHGKMRAVHFSQENYNQQFLAIVNEISEFR